MRLDLITPPSMLAVSPQMVWQHLRLILVSDNGSPETFAPEDAGYVAGLIEAAVSELDGRDGLLSRALITQTWRATLNCFPTVIEIPLPPCRTVQAVTYLDLQGIQQTLDPSQYSVIGLNSLDKALMSPKVKGRWPATARQSGAVTITFQAGFGDDPDDIPPAITAALLEIIGTRYAFRETVSANAGFSILPDSACRALDRYRVGVL